ncbi:glycosyltransferase family 1 protein [Trinickia symbiotica]|uniref:Glycosyltransferase family 1 protein n=2 Tax=Trinickia symbiotica TaxID=863227 RepID=A0A2T3XV26_9BURK|nr:glycosyltransferase family 1 protein [Trinickia symbiotica]
MNSGLNVLNVSQNYFVRGGSDRYFLTLGDLLAEKGNLVVPFCARSEHDLPSDWARFFPVGANFESPSVIDVVRYHYSTAAKKNLAELVAGQRFDIAHLHIYYGKLTSSILGVLRDARIPTVQTVHDYKLICPVYTCNRDGNPCEACHGKEYWRALIYRCNRGSLLRSAVSMSESYVSRWLGSVAGIDRFVAVSRFFAGKMKESGIDPLKIVVVPNFVDVKRFEPRREQGRYFIYFGRIERSKGIPTLIEAFARMPEVPLVVAGEGEFLQHARALAADSSNIEFVGFKRGKELYDLVGGAVASILPSEAYENCPVSILESFAAARPAIGARIGGIPELIEHGEDGFVFERGNVDELCAYVKTIWSQRASNGMGKAARSKVEQQFSAEVHYRRIRSIYDSLLC